jgi:GNAT superfamily N-acetyltransferase
MPSIRRARSDELDSLNALTGRSVMHWGYEPEFLDWEPEAITLTAEMVQRDPVFVADVDSRVAGFYQLSASPPTMMLDKLFIDPGFIGTGVGKLLWNHAIGSAGAMGAARLSLYSDPNAAGFYLAMGARWMREQATTWPGWNLQVFEFTLPRESTG